MTTPEPLAPTAALLAAIDRIPSGMAKSPNRIRAALLAIFVRLWMARLRKALASLIAEIEAGNLPPLATPTQGDTALSNTTQGDTAQRDATPSDATPPATPAAAELPQPCPRPPHPRPAKSSRETPRQAAPAETAAHPAPCRAAAPQDRLRPGRAHLRPTATGRAVAPPTPVPKIRPIPSAPSHALIVTIS